MKINLAKTLSCLTSLVALVFAIPMHAATYDWVSGSGDWSSPTRWSPNGTPGVDDTIYQTVGGGNNVRVNARERSVGTWTYALTSGNFSLYSTNNSAVTDTLTATNLTFQQSAGNFYARNSGGKLNLQITDLTLNFTGVGDATGNSANVTTSVQFGQINTGGPLNSLTISGDTTIKSSSLLYLNVEGSATLGVLKWDAAATGGTIYLHAGVEGTDATPTVRNTNVTSLDSTQSTALISGAIGTTSRRVATLNITGTAGTTIYKGRLVNNAGNNTAGTLSLQKTGASTQILSGANTYSGTTTITGGKLVINGTHTGAGTYTVNTAGTLAGNGTITTADKDIIIGAGGHLSPGDAGAGTLTLALGTGKLDLTQAGAASLIFTLGAPGTNTSVSLDTGFIDIGTANIDLTRFSFTTAAGFGTGTYTLLSSSQTIVGTLGSNLTGIINGHEATLALSADSKSIVLNVTTSSIPEPRTLALFVGVGSLLGVLLWRRWHS